MKKKEHCKKTLISSSQKILEKMEEWHSLSDQEKDSLSENTRLNAEKFVETFFNTI